MSASACFDIFMETKEFVYTGEALRTDSSYLLHCPQLWKVAPLVA